MRSHSSIAPLAWSFLLAGCTPLLLAVDLPGEARAYLAKRIRVEWKLKPLGAVLDELVKAIERPLERSPALNEEAGRRAVAIIQPDKVSIETALRLLEATHRLHVVAEPLRLRVMTVDEAKEARRRPVQINLAEYGIGRHEADFQTLPIGAQASADDGAGFAPAGGWSRHGGGGGFNLFGSGGPGGRDSPTHAVDAADLVELLKRASSAGGIDQRSGNQFFLRVTPEEEAVMRAVMAEEFRRSTRSTRWRCIFGFAAADGELPTGVVAAAAARALAARLVVPVRLACSSVAGQRVTAGELLERDHVAAALKHDSGAEAVVGNLRTGKTLDLRPLAGPGARFLAYHVTWAEELGKDATSEVVIPAGTWSNNEKKRTTTVDPETKLPATTEEESAGGGTQAGARIPVARPAVWLWAPRGEVTVPTGQALVWCAAHARGRAVIVLEETP